MDEQTLLKTSLVCSIIGIASLFMISQFMNPANLTPTTEDQTFITLNGIVQKITTTNTTTFLTITTKQNADIIVFNHNQSIAKGSVVNIKGKKQDQVIIAEEVTLT